MIQIWSVESGDLVRQLSTSAPVSQIAFSPNGVWLATLQSDRSITFWQTDTGVRSAHLSYPEPIHTIEFSPNGQFLLAASNDRTAQLWQLNFDQTQSAPSLKLDKAHTLTHSQPVYQAIFDATGQRIATTSTDGIARLWDAATGQLLQSFSPGNQAIVQVVSTSDAETAGMAGTVGNTENTTSASLTSDGESAAAMETATVPPPQLYVQFSPDQQSLAVADTQHHIWLWDFNSGQIRKNILTVDALETALPASDFRLNPLDLWSFHPTGHLLVTASSYDVRSDGSYSVNLWNAQTGERVGVLPGHRDSVKAMQFSPDGTYVATASADGMVRLWSAEPGGELPTLTLPRSQIEWAMFVQSDTPQSQTAEMPIPLQPEEKIAQEPNHASFLQSLQSWLRTSRSAQLLALPLGRDLSQPEHLLSGADSTLATVASHSSLVTVSAKIRKSR
jgi:WD40 repeat protein